jgi:hypothetical protein
MKARPWMQIAAVVSAVGLAGAASANDLDRTSNDRSNAPIEAATPDQSVNGAMNRAAQLDSNAPSRETAVRPDASLNAGMNRAAQLGTSAPGAPAATVESSGATGAPNAGPTSASSDERSMNESEESGANKGTARASESGEATPPAGTSDDALPRDDTVPGNATSSDVSTLHGGAAGRAADGAIVAPAERFGAPPATEAREPSNVQGERRLP